MKVGEKVNQLHSLSLYPLALNILDLYRLGDLLLIGRLDS